MAELVNLYDGAYRNYISDTYQQVRVETYGNELGQTSWVTKEESANIPRRVSGGDIRNAVLKAALAAAAEPGPDSSKRIHQPHFKASIVEVIAGKRIMRQSLFAGEQLVLPEANLIPGATAFHPSQLAAYALAHR